MSEYVLDASALLCLFRNEPGAFIVRDCLPESVISAVNYAEVVTKLTETELADEEIDEVLRRTRVEIVHFDREQAYRCGLLRRNSRAYGLSLGDRACLALALTSGATAVTTDRKWMELPDAPPILIARPD